MPSFGTSVLLNADEVTNHPDQPVQSSPAQPGCEDLAGPYSIRTGIDICIKDELTIANTTAQAKKRNAQSNESMAQAHVLAIEASSAIFLR